MSTPNLDKLRGQVRRLESLLVEPEMGLLTWKRAYTQALADVAEWYFTPEEWTEIQRQRSTDLP